MTTQTFTSPISERGQCVIPAPLRKKLRIAPGEELVFWINDKGHLEAEPAHLARARAYKKFNSEADAIADEIGTNLPDKDSETIIAEQRR